MSSYLDIIPRWARRMMEIEAEDSRVVAVMACYGMSI